MFSLCPENRRNRGLRLFPFLRGPLHGAIAALALTPLALFGLVRAQEEPAIVAAAEPSPPVVKLSADYSGGGAGTQRGAVVLTSARAAFTGVRLQATPAQGVTLNFDAQTVDLPQGRPVRLGFLVSGFTAPGTYPLGVTIREATSETILGAFTVELTVRTASTPLVEQPAGVNTTFFIVKSLFGPGDPVVRWLLPSELRGATRTVPLENKTAGSLFLQTILPPTLRSERTGERFSEALVLVEPSGGKRIDTPSVPVQIRIRPESLPAGKYVGQVPLAFAGKTPPPVPANFTLSVRNGWILPLLLLIAGIVTGRVARIFELPLAKMQEELLRRLFYLSEQASAFTETRLADHFRYEFDSVRRMIELASSESERPAIEAQLNEITSTIRMLGAVEEVKRAINQTARPDRPTLLGQVQTIIDLVLQERFQEAETELRALRQRLATPPPGLNAAASTPDLHAVAISVRRFQDARALRERPSEREGFLPIRLGSALWRYRYLRPLFFWALIAGLTLMGFYTVYVNDPIFGAQGLYDYGKCFLWGIGTDMATKTLQALSLPKLSLGGA